MKSNILSIYDEDGNLHWGKLLGFILALALVLTVAGIGIRYMNTGAGWATLPAEKYSAENVQKEYEWFYSMHEQIRANRKSVKDLREKREGLKTLYGQDMTRWNSAAQDEYKQIGTQILQVETALNNFCGQYSARWNNVFHSMAAPGNIPKSCDLLQ